MATIYAVRVGNAPGIYYDIGEYEAQLNGFPGAEGRKFKTVAEARRWLAGEEIDKKGIYAVRRGRAPGIYYSLSDCDAQVRGFEGAECKKFSDVEAAERYLNKRRKKKSLPVGEEKEQTEAAPTAKKSQGEPIATPPWAKTSPAAHGHHLPERVRKTPSREFGASAAGGRPLSVSRRLKRHPGAASPLSNEHEAYETAYNGAAQGARLRERRRQAERKGSRTAAIRNPHEMPIVIYTDGGCLVREDGAGGWGAVICLPNGNKKELSGGVDSTSSERMELLAAVSALRTLQGISYEGQRVVVNTDSRYLTDGAEKRIWLTANTRKTPLPNEDLWQELSRLTALYAIDWQWIKGHSGNPFNERCDFLATTAAKQSVAEKEFVHDYAGQLEHAKRQIKDLEHQNRKLTHSKEKFQFLARRKGRIEDKNLYSAIHDGSIMGFLKWKFQMWREGRKK